MKIKMMQNQFNHAEKFLFLEEILVEKFLFPETFQDLEVLLQELLILIVCLVIKHQHQKQRKQSKIKKIINPNIKGKIQEQISIK